MTVLSCVMLSNFIFFSSSSFSRVDCGNTPDSSPNSPPAGIAGSRGSPTSAPIQEENEDPNYQGVRGSINDLSLYTSPSMPNISLGRPHLPNAHTANNYVSCRFYYW